MRISNDNPEITSADLFINMRDLLSLNNDKVEPMKKNMLHLCQNYCREWRTLLSEELSEMPYQWPVIPVAGGC